MEDKILEIEKYAKDENVPIMLKDGINFLKDFISKNNIKNILEIGTAIGYSAINMASVSKDIKVVSIERDESRYNKAKEYINDLNLNEQITLIKGDALETSIEGKFDLIFIDAAKAQNEKLFLRYLPNLNKKGFIVTDNLSFHGYVAMNISDIKSKNIRGLVKKIRNYIEFLKKLDNFNTIFYDIGDGISITQEKGD